MDRQKTIYTTQSQQFIATKLNLECAFGEIITFGFWKGLPTLACYGYISTIFVTYFSDFTIIYCRKTVV